MISEQKLQKIITGAVRDTVTAHGDKVAGSWAGSLSKRVLHDLRGALAQEYPNTEQRKHLISFLRSASCPDPECIDGSIQSTGPEPLDDACEWCYQRHMTLEALQEQINREEA